MTKLVVCGSYIPSERRRSGRRVAGSGATPEASPYTLAEPGAGILYVRLRAFTPPPLPPARRVLLCLTASRLRSCSAKNRNSYHLATPGGMPHQGGCHIKGKAFHKLSRYASRRLHHTRLHSVACPFLHQHRSSDTPKICMLLIPTFSRSIPKQVTTASTVRAKKSQTTRGLLPFPSFRIAV